MTAHIYMASIEEITLCVHHCNFTSELRIPVLSKLQYNFPKDVPIFTTSVPLVSSFTVTKTVFGYECQLEDDKRKSRGHL